MGCLCLLQHQRSALRRAAATAQAAQSIRARVAPQLLVTSIVAQVVVVACSIPDAGQRRVQNTIASICSYR